MNKTITIKIKNVYGLERFYPQCEQGKIFAQLTKKITLDMDDLNNIKKLGYILKVQSQTLNNSLLTN